MNKMTGKITHVGVKQQADGSEKIDSILLNVGLSKTLAVPYNDKTFAGAAVRKGNVVEFEHDGIFEVDFEDRKTGEVKAGSYLEADNFKMVSQREPEIIIHRKAVSLSQHPSDAPHPADVAEKDPANFSV